MTRGRSRGWGFLGVGGPGGQDPPFWGTPKLHKEGKKTLSMYERKSRALLLNSYPDPPFRNPVSAPDDMQIILCTTWMHSTENCVPRSPVARTNTYVLYFFREYYRNHTHFKCTILPNSLRQMPQASFQVIKDA